MIQPKVEGFITSATIEVRFMPGIPASEAVAVGQRLLSEVRRGTQSYGATANVLVHGEYTSISIDSVELYPMTAETYGSLIQRLTTIADDFRESRR